jgi:hypothetical protein
MEAKEDRERAKKETKEAKKAKAQDKKGAEQVATKEDKGAGAELYKGIVRLTIVPPVDSGQVRKLEEHLSQVPDLRLVLIGGSIAEGTEIVVATESPIPLLDILRDMPPVAQVTKKGKTTQITLKAE